ncbi:DUF444 family protein [Alkalilimnicola sp. S0819]|uniref:DUF444 family protein n=1 Tax=Alkalilimnicola sp. S0819 TaxID=2613922 RepID=UPI0012614EF2|nr:DUF444 family protein [Alkalilimnicola sp. S0819]KAB7624298.1 DUF444 family protein [Alkalilimnicola sp. S0819]MPQ16122.1 DUF444 family protein [Alkalilimnicola sp. S0819]
MNPGTEDQRWYELFSRGTRDWLRHNEKVREAVRGQLPDLVAGSDVLSRPGRRTVQVPVRFMEHARFRLADTEEQQGAGQGPAQPGDVLRRARRRGLQPEGAREGEGGEDEGGIRMVLEFQVDDILDWLWEELQLPHLKPRAGHALEHEEPVREGWDKRGARPRLDRRRTLKEAIKRRHALPRSRVPIADEDLRFRQLTRRRRPNTQAVVFLLLDVSSSMDEHCRRLAKTFFFWALQGIRRQFASMETVFIAHTVQAWEFQEEAFFQVHGEGGTRSSTAFELAARVLRERYDPTRYNAYLFYATDGHNFSEDRQAAMSSLHGLAEQMNFLGYAEVSHHIMRRLETEVAQLYRALQLQGFPCGSYALSTEEDIWPAIRRFFSDQAREASAHG